MLCSTLYFTNLYDCQIGVCEVGVGGGGASLLYFHLSIISRAWAWGGVILKSSISTIFTNYTNNTRAEITISTKIEGKGLGRLVSTNLTRGIFMLKPSNSTIFNNSKESGESSTLNFHNFHQDLPPSYYTKWGFIQFHHFYQDLPASFKNRFWFIWFPPIPSFSTGSLPSSYPKCWSYDFQH